MSGISAQGKGEHTFIAKSTAGTWASGFLDHIQSSSRVITYLPAQAYPLYIPEKCFVDKEHLLPGFFAQLE
jgi:hypothetical protein